MAYLTAAATLLSLACFITIVIWAWSGARRRANDESALLPFALPDEAGPSFKRNIEHE